MVVAVAGAVLVLPLRLAEPLEHQLADALPQIVWAANGAGVNDYINTRWFEYTGEPPPRRPDWDWRPQIHPDDLPALEEAWRASLATGRRVDGGEHDDRDGRAFQIA